MNPITQFLFFWLYFCLDLVTAGNLPDTLDSAQLQLLNNKLNSIVKRSSTSNATNVEVGKIKGISLGGWLVTEPYITPSLYKNATSIFNSMNPTNSTNSTDVIIDEYTLCEKLGYDTAKSLLAPHFDSFITEEDFKQIKEDGFNLVRIPIGYWAWKQDNTTNLYLDDIYFQDPYVSDGLQLEYLSKAIEWAASYNLSVWVDFHGAPGSQNGFDNSGKRDLYGTPGWLSVNKSAELTKAIWNDIFENYVIEQDQSTTPIVGIEIVNEPLGSKIPVYDITKMFYEGFELFEDLKQSSNNIYNTTFVIHDAFQGIDHWNLEFNPNFKNVSSQYVNLTDYSFDSQDILVDHHHYEVFSDFQLGNSQFRRLYDIIEYGESIFKELKYHPAVVGEWSAAITDCATWLNGVGIGSRYDGSYYKTTNFTTEDSPFGTCTSQLSFDQWSDEYKKNVRQFIESQLATYSSQTTGWIFWNWKTEDAIEWDYLKLKEEGLFPSPFNNFTYFNSDGSIKSAVSKSLSTLAYPKTSSSSKSQPSKSTSTSKSFATSLTKSTPFFPSSIVKFGSSLHLILFTILIATVSFI